MQQGQVLIQGIRMFDMHGTQLHVKHLSSYKLQMCVVFSNSVMRVGSAQANKNFQSIIKMLVDLLRLGKKDFLSES